MKIEGVLQQGKRLGKGDFKFSFKDGKLTMIVSAKPRPKDEEFSPMEDEKFQFSLEGRNLKSLVRLIVEGKDSLIKKARRERENIGFDEKFSSGDDYMRIRGYSWAFTILIRSGNKEGFLILKPKEFYPLVCAAENYVKALPESTSIITKDLDFVICNAKKGEGLFFRTVETDEVIGKITDRAVLASLACDIDDRIRIDGMYPAKFGTITLMERQGEPYIRIAGRYYKTDRQGLLTLQLLSKIAIDS